MTCDQGRYFRVGIGFVSPSVMATLFVLFETAYGFALFERIENDEIGQNVEAVTASMQDSGKFSKAVKLHAFLPFKNAAEALQNINDVSEGIMGSTLRDFLEQNLPKSKKSKDGTPKKSKSSYFTLGVADKTLGSSIKNDLGVDCVSDEAVLEVVRGLRQFSQSMLKHFKEGDLEKAQLGLGHSYSRAKVKFNVHRSDNMIIQSSALLDQLDKDINTFAMRMREWYGWHFPELTKLVTDHRLFAKVVLSIPNKAELTEEQLPLLETATDGDAGLAKLILDAARSSMGTDVNELDMINIKNFAKRVLDLSEYRQKLHSYLSQKMDLVAPNLSALIGEIVGARLISHAGSLTNLSKFPASTVQILGAEKALFRALKTKGKTPKYGLIYHSSFIGKAGLKNKGRISRYLANKCAIASRLDCFSDVPTNLFGDALRSQVEERLDFYEKGVKPTKNSDVMARVMKAVGKAQASEEKSKKRKSKEIDAEIEKESSPAKKDKKDKDVAMVVDEEIKPSSEKEKKKDKKDKKKDKNVAMVVDEDVKSSEKKKSSKKEDRKEEKDKKDKKKK